MKTTKRHDERYCSICSSNKTQMHKVNGKDYPHWYKLNGKHICFKCCERLIKSKKEGYKTSHKKGQRKYVLNNPEKIKAQMIVNKKKLIGLACEKCGKKECRLEGHHPDYSNPNKITTLCVEHHKEIHNG